MSRRIPLSKESKLVDSLVADHQSVRWGSIPADATSDGDAVRLACATAMRSAFSDGTPTLDELFARGLAGEYLIPYDVTMAARWRRCRQVYRFDAELADALARTDHASEVPVDALRMLPYPIVGIEAPGLPTPIVSGMVRSDGVLAWIDRDAETGEDVLAMCWVLDGAMAKRTCAWVPLVASSLGEVAAQVIADNDPLGERSRDEASEMADSFATCVGRVLSLLLYVVSEGADVETVYSPPSGARGQRAGRRSSHETVHAVGARVGRALGEARRAHASSRPGSGRSVAPHVRAAHWQHYWVGPRKGRTDGRHGDRLIVRWIAPTLVGVGDVGEVVHEAR